ncbi:MAG: hypothetical protein JW820_16875 [Spirochaetales bacterium]|nr:hypothetical protein [Spirochaetales bacterium]
MRKSLLAILLVLVPFSAGWALGNPEAGEYEAVEGLENWDYRLDIEGRKAGKYNLIVRGTDQAGNVRYEGPYNLFVDPESDLPVTRISYPAAAARAGALLNVVGTAVDDDGVQAVEVQLDDREWMAVNGTEYWSIVLDLQRVSDGEHVLRARCLDVNGLAGNPDQVHFQLDKQAPVIQMSSHADGSLVSGTVEVEGSIQDANGVAALALSLDEGESWAPLRISLDKERTQGSFRVKIDTREKPDGPLVLWLEGTDRMGSEARYPFLVFVNNDSPELTILSPAEGAAVNGRVLVAGMARDKVGLQALRYQLAGGEEGSIALTPGNPFWTHELDLSATKKGTVQVVYTLRNLAGNEQVAKLRLEVDPLSDLPRVTLVSPEEAAQVSGAVLVAGFVADDDAVDRVEYTLDAGEPVSVPTVSAFAAVLEEVPPGPHRLAVRAVDVGGVAGSPSVVSFACAGPAPVITAATLLEAGAAVPFVPGTVYTGEKDGRLTGAIRFAGARLQAEYALQGDSYRPLALKKGAGEEERLYELALPKSLPAGRVDFAVRATDGFGATGELRSFLFKGVEPTAEGILLVDARIDEQGVLLLDGEPLRGFVTGGPIREAALQPETPLLRIETDGSTFRVHSQAPGVSGPTRITVTAADGRSYESEPIGFVTDLLGPELSIAQPQSGRWVSDTLEIAGRTRDPGGVAGVEYSLDGASWSAIGVEEGVGESLFAAALPVESLAEGPHLLRLRALDRAGNATQRQVPFHRDVTPPTVSLIAPRPEDQVNGTTTVVGRAVDAGAVALVEVSEDGSDFRPVGNGREFAFDLNLSKLPGEAGRIWIRCTDEAGNQSLLEPRLSVDLAADRPEVQIQLPADGALIRNDFVLSGMVFDDDGVAAVYYRVDDGEFQPLPGGHNFSVPLSLTQIGDNEHTIEVKAEDLGGLESETSVVRFQVSTSDPVTSLAAPAIDAHVQGVLELEGTSADPNGIAEVRISLDNGVSYLRANGGEEWSYRLDTRLLADGTHAVLVEAEDATGATGLYTTTINVDNEAPDLVLDSPKDGQVLTSDVLLSGRVVDAVGLSRLAASVTPVSSFPPAETEAGGKELPAQDEEIAQESQALDAVFVEESLALGEVIQERLDIDQLPPGWYNLRLEASDQAGNLSYVSRNFLKRPSGSAERVELFYPADGEHLAGPLNIAGRVYSERSLAGATIVVTLDGGRLETGMLSSTGHFHLKTGPEQVPAGSHSVQVQLVLAGEPALESEPHRFEYELAGPWVDITSLALGDYVSGRPFLEGQAGYARPEAPGLEQEPTDGKAAGGKGGEGTPKVELIEVSMDNGRSFRKADGRQAWRYRLETLALPNGPLRLLVRATFSDGQTAVTRTQLSVDTRPPALGLLAPAEGGRFNDSIPLVGTGADESGLQEIAVSLREGDKSRYQVPAFIQGLYLDFHAMGATYFDAGVGLTFFEDNVKLQLQIGLSPPGRFSGLVIGAKLLANVATLPFGYFFGPSWDFFSMSLAVGANFSYFTMSEGPIEFTDAGLVLGGVVAQLEFARFEIARWRALNAYALYTEYQLWFISSDIEAGTASRIAFGLRVELF